MKIIDLDGKEITVTDLDKAIQQAGSMRDWQHAPPVPSDAERQRYWKDLHQKLTQLKNEANAKK